MRRANALGFIVVLLVCGSTLVQARDYTISVMGGGQIVAGREFDTLAADDGLGLFHLEFGLELEELLQGLTLEVAYETGARGEALFAGEVAWLSTDLALHSLVLSAVYRYPVTEWFVASARVGGSLDFARVELKDDGQVLLRDWDKAKVGAIGTLGAEFAIPRKVWKRWFRKPPGDPQDGFTLGLRFEIGWSFRQAFSFDGMRGPATGSDEEARRRIDRAAVDLGSVDLDGLMFRAGAFVVF